MSNRIRSSLLGFLGACAFLLLFLDTLVTAGVYWLHESGAVDRLNEFGAWLTRVIG